MNISMDKLKNIKSKSIALFERLETLIYNADDSYNDEIYDRFYFKVAAIDVVLQNAIDLTTQEKLTNGHIDHIDRMLTDLEVDLKEAKKEFLK